MNRVLGVAAAVLLAGGVAFWLLGGTATPESASARIEKLIAAGKLDDAKSEAARMRPRLDPATADYLDGLLLFSEGRFAESVDVLERARRVRPTDWRIVGVDAAATAKSGRFPHALAIVEAYVAAAPDDERGL